MLRIAVMTVLAAFLWPGASQAADITDIVMERGIIIHAPDNAASGKLPAVIVMHGGGGSAAQVRRQTGMDAVADKNGFVAVYPEGTTGLAGKFGTWNAGDCCGAAKKKDVDDVAFISAVIDRLVHDLQVPRTDAQRHLGAGCELSNGRIDRKGEPLATRHRKAHAPVIAEPFQLRPCFEV